LQESRGYWVTTGLFCLALTFSGLAHGLGLGPIPEAMKALGYPPYVSTLLGVAKLAGVVALVVPGRPVLKEWAYAGFTFNLLGAFASHLFAGDPLAEALPPLLLLGLAAASYHLRPAQRRLAV
jgi:hypothetical protein